MQAKEATKVYNDALVYASQCLAEMQALQEAGNARLYNAIHYEYVEALYEVERAQVEVLQALVQEYASYHRRDTLQSIQAIVWQMQVYAPHIDNAGAVYSQSLLCASYDEAMQREIAQARTIS